MQYFSTRDSELRVSAQEAIVRGLAPQSGLFVPEAFPKANLEGWKNLSYPELAEKVLAGFLTILPENVIQAYPKRILNIHPSLIPSFCGAGFYGLKVHEAALAKGVKVTGATVHFVNEIPDGGEIIAQKAVEVLPGDTPEVLQKRVMEQAEWILLPQAVEDVARNLCQQ